MAKLGHSFANLFMRAYIFFQIIFICIAVMLVETMKMKVGLWMAEKWKFPPAMSLG